MGKVAFVFPGQGAQYPGMGKALADHSPAAAEVFRQADAARPGTSEQCFGGSEEALKDTATTQPCMFTVEMATAAALEEAGIHADMAAGFSLGELAALSYGNVVDLSTSLKLVTLRGQLMAQCAAKADTAMAAVLRLSSEEVEQICAQFHDTYPVNYNCPGQVAVALLRETLPAFTAAVKAAGGRALPLKVGGGFHSPFMAAADQEFGEALQAVPFRTPAIALYANCTGLPYDGDVKDLLSRQICSPVRWEEAVRNMIAAGADTFLEVGPGNTLCGLIKKIDPAVRTFQISTPEELKQCVQEVILC